MNPSWEKALEILSRPEFSCSLQGIRRGIERESLRVDRDSRLAPTPHPAPLGSPLTHSFITTDYAEAMMEFITPAGSRAEETLDILADIHRHAYRHLGEELLWPVSMPCTIEAEEDIGLARYGSSTVGRKKTLYRRGLKNRYGSMMQIIAGVHYNFSMPDEFWPVWQQIKEDRQPLQDFISESYLGLIRNFLRFGWLIPYFFGASPAVDSSFLKHVRSKLPLEPFGQDSHYLPNATSLRMSDLGYNAKQQDDLAIGYNSLPDFVDGLRRATSQSHPVFEKIGLKQNGEYQQLNTNILQQEGELYAPIRPKRVTRTGEQLSCALQDRGIEYIEVRSLDVNPYAETGIDITQVRFLDIFLTFCLLKDSPDLSPRQQRTTKQNLNKVAACGRDLSLELLDGENTRSLEAWADDIFTGLAKVARLLDKADQGKKFQAALNIHHQRLTTPSLTPSARIVNDMAEQKMAANELALSLAEKHRRKLLENDYMQIQADEFAREAAASRQKQKQLEEADTRSLDGIFSLSLDSIPPAPCPLGRGLDKSCQWPAPAEHRDSSGKIIAASL